MGPDCPLLHPDQFPGGVGGKASADHVYGSTLPPVKVGSTGGRHAGMTRKPKASSRPGRHRAE